MEEKGAYQTVFTKSAGSAKGCHIKLRIDETQKNPNSKGGKQNRDLVAAPSNIYGASPHIKLDVHMV